MTVHPAPLGEAAAELRDGRREVSDYVADRYGRIDDVESDVQALVDGPKPREWVDAEATALMARHPSPTERPPLFGVPVGVKDIFNVSGLPTRGGSTVPPGELVGPQAAVVSELRAAGALVLGKTVTTEFAYFEPGPTRNPHDLHHTPGGSSSGSAAAVAAGIFPLALGTQTIGSIIRPAAFCGVVGFKPSFGRIPLDGVLPLAPSVDHVGLFTQDVSGMEVAASVCVEGWEEPDVEVQPVLGVPEGEYLSQASDVGVDAFERHVTALEDAGYDVRRVQAFDDIEAVTERHNELVAAEAAVAHNEWFEAYSDRYADSTAELIQKGQDLSVKAITDARRGRHVLRSALEETMTETGIDVWVSPGAPGPAPEGIETTGDPVMNLPWTHAGMPAIGLPAEDVDGLPVGLQCVAAFGRDERLLAWSGGLMDALSAL